MPDRVSPIGLICGHIDELFAPDKTLPKILEDVARLGAQLLAQAALKAEVTEFPPAGTVPAGRGLWGARSLPGL